MKHFTHSSRNSYTNAALTLQPTNHLDSDTVRALCEALEGYAGAIIAVSHDENFVNRVIASASTVSARAAQQGVDIRGELWVMSKQALKRFDGSFLEYKKIIRKSVVAGVNHNDL